MTNPAEGPPRKCPPGRPLPRPSRLATSFASRVNVRRRAMSCGSPFGIVTLDDFVETGTWDRRIKAARFERVKSLRAGIHDDAHLDLSGHPRVRETHHNRHQAHGGRWNVANGAA